MDMKLEVVVIGVSDVVFVDPAFHQHRSHDNAYGW